MVVKVKLKKWGSSIGCVIPKDIIEKNDLQEDDEIFLTISKKKDMRDLFNTMQLGNAQENKDFVRRGSQ